jgi:predicted Zn-dependent protease
VRRTLLFLLALALCVQSSAQNLPDLGDVSQAVFSPALERRLGDSIMEQIRADRSYLDDPVITDYLNALGSRLVASSPDTRQLFEFFLIKDPSVNAFALPGGYIGVHTGLITTAQTESELAGVLAHEVAHVTQRHIARMLAGQERNSLMTLAAMAVGVLAARANSNLGQAIIAGSQAAAIQSQLDYTREHEREADRIGVSILERAGFDVHGMPSFMERLQRATRQYDTNAPDYLRTHPVTTERIADLQNRTETQVYKQIPDNPMYQLVRARVRAISDEPRQAVTFFEQGLKERRFINEAATRYGLAIALLRAKDYPRATRELSLLEKTLPEEPAIAALRGQYLVATGDSAAALAHYGAAVQKFPRYRALVYDYADTLIIQGRPETALKLVDDQLQHTPGDSRLYLLQSRSYAAQGKRLLQHQAQAEAYLRQGHLRAAVEQLQIASRAGDGDFYQLSSVEARLRELRGRLKEAELAKRP